MQLSVELRYSTQAQSVINMHVCLLSMEALPIDFYVI